jgi:hypothetical protein
MMKKDEATGGVLKVFSPVAAQAPLYVPPAKRPATLNQKTVGLIWNGKPGGEVALAVVRESIRKAFPEIKVFESSWNSYPFTDSQIEKIVSSCDVVVGTTGD